MYKLYFKITHSTARVQTKYLTVVKSANYCVILKHG